MAESKRSVPDSGAPGEVTQLLDAARAGDETAGGRLFTIVYEDLRRLAHRHLRGARGAGPSSTSLVHEVFLRLAHRGDLPFADRSHFFAVISRAMRQIAIDQARRRVAEKRGGGAVDIELDAGGYELPASNFAVEELLSIHRALDQLEQDTPRLARTVEWHFFGGLTFQEIADAAGVSERTVQRDWRTARAILHTHLEPATT